MTRQPGKLESVLRTISPRFHAPDARGVLHPLLDPSEFLRLPHTRNAALRACRTERIAGRSAVVFALFAVASCAGMTGFYEAPGAACAFLFILSAVTWSLLNRPRAVKARILSICRAANSCAACGYECASIPPDADGVTTCPECAAAWKFEPIDAQS